MPIVSSAILKIRPRGNGRLRVFELHTDHNGDTHPHRYSTVEGHDTAQALLDWIPKKDAQLISSEKDSFQAAIENGKDPDSITLKHLNASQKAKRVIRALMRGSSYRMLKAALYIQNFTDAQIENHYSEAQRIRIRAMQNHIINNQVVFETDLREEL